MAWYDNIGSTVGGFFGQEDDRLRELRMQNSADFNIAGNSEQAQMLAEQDKMFEDNATTNNGWDLKGMATAFLGDEEAKPEPMVTSGKLMRGSGNAVQPIEPMMPQAKPQQSQAANAIMMAMQQNQQNQPQVAQQQPSMFQKMMGFA